jgi:hypothetical protein
VLTLSFIEIDPLPTSPPIAGSALLSARTPAADSITGGAASGGDDNVAGGDGAAGFVTGGTRIATGMGAASFYPGRRGLAALAHQARATVVAAPAQSETNPPLLAQRARLASALSGSVSDGASPAAARLDSITFLDLHVLVNDIVIANRPKQFAQDAIGMRMIFRNRTSLQFLQLLNDHFSCHLFPKRRRYCVDLLNEVNVVPSCRCPLVSDVARRMQN